MAYWVFLLAIFCYISVLESTEDTQSRANTILMGDRMNFEDHIQSLATYVHDIQKTPSIHEKIEILDRHPRVKTFIERGEFSFLGMDPSSELVCKEIIALDQDRHLFRLWDHSEVRRLIPQLLQIEDFYQDLGGILGYHLQMLKLLRKSETTREGMRFFPPAFLDIREENEEVMQAVLWGLEYLPMMAEFYPLGGAADRLHLVDEKTGTELPAAKLEFLGKTLLEHLISDLEGRENLYAKIFGKKIITPVVIMSSQEKNNHHHVLEICEEKNWFGRGKENFFIFIQPLVPTLTEEGNWCMKSKGEMLMKPGGHGALWKLAKDKGALSWLKEKGRSKALIRQINNPLAGLDYGLLAFAGWGCGKKQHFGFSSCPRLVGAAEGVNLLVEKKNNEGYEFFLTNIEYCDFEKWGIEDIPEKGGEKYSQFSSNTNILFADLEAIEKAVENCPFPGMLINLKDVSVGDRQVKVARLESTMQNIADALTERSSVPFEEGFKISKTFACYNHRRKTISPAKRAYIPGRTSMETPERALYDLHQSFEDLLTNYCNFDVPKENEFEEYLSEGPTVLYSFHPTLGPLFSVIGQKINKGKIHPFSEMRLDVSELEIFQLELQGSLIISADTLTRQNSGKCILRHVKIENEGVDWSSSKQMWKGHPKGKEQVKIVLHGNGEFHAENVIFHGAHHFEVKDGQRMVVRQEGEGIQIETEQIEKPTWSWKMTVQSSSRIVLSR